MPRKQLCTVMVKGVECQRQIPDDIYINICARHLLVAAAEVEKVGPGYLRHIVREEGL